MPHIYEIKTEQFSGPLEKLLELIESQQMNITSVSLASVTADFLHYLNHLQTAETANPNLDKDSLHRLISDFIVVASRLLLIKSKHLLPQIELTPEEGTEIFDLEERLKIYKEIKLASIHVKSLWTDNRHSSARDLFQNTLEQAMEWISDCLNPVDSFGRLSVSTSSRNSLKMLFNI